MAVAVAVWYGVAGEREAGPPRVGGIVGRWGNSVCGILVVLVVSKGRCVGRGSEESEAAEAPAYMRTIPPRQYSARATPARRVWEWGGEVSRC